MGVILSMSTKFGLGGSHYMKTIAGDIVNMEGKKIGWTGLYQLLKEEGIKKKLIRSN